MPTMLNHTFRQASIAILAIASVSAFAQYPGSTLPPKEVAQGFGSISQDVAYHHLSYLAGPETAGRGSGQPGYMAAAEYVANQFKSMGLEPIGDNGSYFQGVPFTRFEVDPAGTYLVGPSMSVKSGNGMSVSGVSGRAGRQGNHSDLLGRGRYLVV